MLLMEKSARAQAETNGTSSIKVEIISTQVIQSCVVSFALLKVHYVVFVTKF